MLMQREQSFQQKLRRIKEKICKFCKRAFNISKTLEYEQTSQQCFDVEHEKFTKLDKYINEWRIQKLLVSIIKECFSKESEIKIEKMTAINSKLRIKLRITMSLLRKNSFKEKIRSIQNFITDSVEVYEVQDYELADEMIKQFIAVEHPKKPEAFLIMMRKEETLNFLKEAWINKQKRKILKRKICFQIIFEQQIKQQVFAECQKSKQLEIVIEKREGKLIVEFSGYQTVKTLKIISHFENKKRELENKLYTDNMFFGKQQSNILQKILEKIKRQARKRYSVELKLIRSPAYDSIITLGSQSLKNTFEMPLVAFIKETYELSSLPFGTSIVFLENQMNLFEEQYLNDFKQKNSGQSKGRKVDQSRGLELIYIQNRQELSLSDIEKEHPFNQEKKKFAFIVPDKEKQDFVFQILRFFEKKIHQKSIQIFFFHNPEQTLNLNSPINIKTWYVKDGTEKFFFPDHANEKINKAAKNNQNKVLLYPQELNLKKNTHKLNFKNNIVTHEQSGQKAFILFLSTGKAEIFVNGKNFQIQKQFVNEWLKQKQQKKTDQIQIKLAIYEIDLKNKQQVNIFTNYKRNLYFKESSVQSSHFLANDEPQFTELKLFYRNNPVEVQKDVRAFIRAQLRKKKIQEKMASNANFPKIWEAQTNEIQTFEVSSKTQEFQKIQKAFTKSEIKKLIRIQNRPVYEKYFYEKEWLACQNQGKQVQEKMLFHGTGKTNPSTIYEDVEDSFNVNYTSQGNYLGRGTYFAEKSEYAHNYSYTSDGIREVLYCSVLKGESQKIHFVTPQSKMMRNTDFKPGTKLRYESATTFTNNSVIYNVYKNRRAYPMYLIKY